MRALAAGEDPHRRGPARQLVPAGPSRSSPVSSVTCASSIQHRAVRAGQVRAGVIGAALADLAAAGRWRSARPAPGPAGSPPSPARPAPSRRSRSAGSPGRARQLIQAGDQPVAGPGPVAGDHQPPPERRRQRGDRRRPAPAGDRRWCSTRRCRGAASRPAAQPVLSQYAEQRVMTEPFEIRLREFLVRVRRGDGGIQPDAGHPVQGPVRDPHAGQRAVAGLDLPPTPAGGPCSPPP